MTGSKEDPVIKEIPREYRQRVVVLTAQGWTTKAIQEALGVSRAWVDSIKRLQKSGLSLDIRSSANHRNSLAERQGERIAAWVAEHPGTTLAQLKADLGLAESIWTIWQTLRALGLSLKTPGGRAGAAGCRPKTGRVAGRSHRPRPEPVRLPR